LHSFFDIGLFVGHTAHLNNTHLYFMHVPGLSCKSKEYGRCHNKWVVHAEIITILFEACSPFCVMNPLRRIHKKDIRFTVKDNRY
ncbi:MAG TPA: hypothetical protein VGD17_11295, partial [Chitinophagaceae bacterium]